MATPHVTGAAALLIAHDAGLNVAGLRSALLSSADPVPALAGRVAPAGASTWPRRSPCPRRRPAARAGAGAGLRTGRDPARNGRLGRRPHRARGVAADRPADAARGARPRPAPRARRLRGVRTRIEVRIDARSARRLHLSWRTVARASVRLTRAGTRAVTARVSSRAARALRSATRVRVVARAVAVDAAGNRRGTERAATLRR